MNPFNGTMPVDWHQGTVSEIIELHDSKRIPLSSRERADLAKVYPYYGATSIMDYVDRYLFDGIYLLLGEDGTVADSKGFPTLAICIWEILGKQSRPHHNRQEWLFCRVAVSVIQLNECPINYHRSRPTED